MEKVLPQLEAHFVDDVTESVFYRPVADFPEGVGGGASSDELTEAYSAAIQEKIIPSYKKLHAFMRDEYMPELPRRPPRSPTCRTARPGTPTRSRR